MAVALAGERTYPSLGGAGDEPGNTSEAEKSRRPSTTKRSRLVIDPGFRIATLYERWRRRTRHIVNGCFAMQTSFGKIVPTKTPKA